MPDYRLTRSIDTFTVEVYNLNGAEYVDIIRTGLRGTRADATFLKGDSAGAAGFLSQLSKLFGTGLITIAPEGDDAL